ncbi:hypothetical protein BACI71_110824 [Bacillus mycoides]|uniref:Uncharacterized protein n=1 Tax=Bacillus mycoides TaxID=1405 RepID=A0A653RQB9_BACMY|nr:hypothetical protein BACI71_110824 [Bacillus mycoides]
MWKEVRNFNKRDVYNIDKLYKFTIQNMGVLKREYIINLSVICFHLFVIFLPR